MLTLLLDVGANNISFEPDRSMVFCCFNRDGARAKTPDALEVLEREKCERDMSANHED